MAEVSMSDLRCSHFGGKLNMSDVDENVTCEVKKAKLVAAELEEVDQGEELASCFFGQLNSVFSSISIDVANLQQEAEKPMRHLNLLYGQKNGDAGSNDEGDQLCNMLQSARALKDRIQACLTKATEEYADLEHFTSTMDAELDCIEEQLIQHEDVFHSQGFDCMSSSQSQASWDEDYILEQETVEEDHSINQDISQSPLQKITAANATLSSLGETSVNDHILSTPESKELVEISPGLVIRVSRKSTLRLVENPPAPTEELDEQTTSGGLFPPQSPVLSEFTRQFLQKK